MISKNELKYYSSLLQKKFRTEEKKFLVEGEKSVLEGLNSSYKPEIIFVTHEEAEANPDLTEFFKSKTRVEILKNQEFNKISDTVNPQGISAVFHKPKKILSFEEIRTPVIVILDNISDPGNTGTILRTCDWFGIKQVVLSSGCSEVYNPKTLRGSAGSIFHLNIYENAELSKVFELLRSKGYKIFYTDLHGENIFDTDFPQKTALVFSNEANGPSDVVKQKNNSVITIPGSGKAESLNVATAAGIVLAEALRRSINKK